MTIPVPVVGIGAALTYMLVWGLLTRRGSRESRTLTAQDRASVDARHPLLAVPVPWMYLLAYLAALGVELLVPLRVRWSPALLAGLLPLGVGAVIAFSALGIFKSSRTTTVPFGTPAQLILRGPYRFTRNPMYLGLAMAYAGVAITNGQVWPILLLPLVLIYVHHVVIPIEERRLHETFGEAYDHYRAQVRRWI